MAGLFIFKPCYMIFILWILKLYLFAFTPDPKSMGADLKPVKITSRVGDMLVASSTDLKGVISLKSARELYGKTASACKLRVGRVFDVIGRVDEPYIVIRLSKNINNPDRFIGETAHIK
jgi:rRNA processing protein Gar1